MALRECNPNAEQDKSAIDQRKPTKQNVGDGIVILDVHGEVLDTVILKDRINKTFNNNGAIVSATKPLVQSHAG